MKKYTSALAICVMMVACSGDDNNNNGTTTPGADMNTTTDMNGGGSMDMTGGGNTDMGGGGGTTDMGGGGGTADMAGGGGDDMGGGGGGNGEFCQEECATDADCTIGGQNTSNFTCDATTKRCTAPPADGCTTDDECVAQFSGWVTDCTSAADCPGQVCTESGKCATSPSEFFMCETAQLAELETRDIDGNDVTVCAQTRATCNSDSNFCELRCTEDSHCANNPGGNVCDTDTGQCKCNDDSNCTVDGFSSCKANSLCGCGADTDCANNASGDVCNMDTGACNCSDASVCGDTVFDGTTSVCE